MMSDTTEPTKRHYTLTERVRGQTARMRADALAQGASCSEPFFRDVETLCDMAEGKSPPPQDDAHVADGCRLFSDPAKIKDSQDDPRPPSPPKGQPEWA